MSERDRYEIVKNDRYELVESPEDKIQSNARQAEDFLASRGDANANLKSGVAWAENYLNKSNSRYEIVQPEGYNESGTKTLGAAIRHGLDVGGYHGVRALVGMAKANKENSFIRDAFWKTGAGKMLAGAKPLVEGLNKALDSWVDDMEPGLETYIAENQSEQMQLNPDDNFWETTWDIMSHPEKLLQGVVESIPLMLEAGLGTILGGAVGGIAVMSQPIAGEAYMNARAEGTSPMKALVQAQLTGLGEAAIEEWTFGKKLGLAKGFSKVVESGGRKVLWEGAKLYGRGMVEEGAQQFNQNVWNWFFTDRSQDLTEGVLQSAAIGGPMELVMGGGFAAAGGTYSKLVGISQQHAVVEKMRKEVEESPSLSEVHKAELEAEFDTVTEEILDGVYDPTIEAQAAEEGELAFDEEGNFLGEEVAGEEYTAPQIGDMIVEGEEIDGIAEPIEEDTRTIPEKASDKLRDLIADIPIKDIRGLTDIERGLQLGEKAGRATQAREEARVKGASIKDAQRIAKGVMRGELAKANFPAFTAEQFTPDEWEQVRQAVLDKGMQFYEEEHSLEAVNKLQDGLIPTPSELTALGEVIGKDTANTMIEAARGFKGKVYDFFVNLINFEVTAQAAGELSFVLRQATTTKTKWPKQWAASFVNSHRAYFSEEWSKAKQVDLDTRKHKESADKYGIITNAMDGDPTKQVERFQSAWAKKIPYWGAMVRASNRGAVVGMNSLRAGIWDYYMEQWEGMDLHSSEYYRLARMINMSTGEGNITNKNIKALLPLMNVGIFAPRYNHSRFEMIKEGAASVYDIVTPGKARATSKIMASQLVNFVGSGLLLLTMAAALGASVELNPESSDFGKIVIGRTRIDIWGGFQQIARVVAQLFTGKGKSTRGEKERYTKNRLETIGRFIQSKLSPIGSLSVELLSGKDFLGEPIPEFKDKEAFFEWAIYKKMTFLFVQDIVDAVKFSDSKAATALVFPAAVYGVGVQTYAPSPMDDLTQMQDHYSKEVFQKPWRELGPDAQKALREYRPQIGEQEAIAKFERRNATFDMRKQREAGVEIEESLSDRVQQEMKDNMVTLGGVARTITRNWRLNKDRYKAYKDGVSHVLNQALPKIIDSPNYQLLSPPDRQVLLNEVIKQAKDAVRKDIVMKANMSDLEDIRKGVEDD